MTDKNILKKFVFENNIDCLIGSDEISAEKFIKWFDEVKDHEICGVKIKNYDINSVIRFLDEDLLRMYTEIEDKK